MAIGAYFDLTEDSPPGTQPSSTPHTNAATNQNSWIDEECWEPVDTTVHQTHTAPTRDRNDFNKMKTTAYSMSIIQDMTLTEDTLIPPRTKFVKQWKIQNTGNSAWPPGSHLRIISGNRTMAAQEKIFINPQVQVETEKFTDKIFYALYLEFYLLTKHRLFLLYSLEKREKSLLNAFHLNTPEIIKPAGR